MTLHDVVNLSGHFKRVDVLGVITQQFAMFFEFFDEHMRQRGPKLTGIDLFGELEKRARIVFKIENVKHGLRVGQIGKVDPEPGVDAVARSKIGYAARYRAAGAG